MGKVRPFVIIVTLRLIQTIYASGIFGFFVIALYIPGLTLFLPISRLLDVDDSRGFNYFMIFLLPLAATGWYFWKAKLVKLDRWRNEKRLLFAAIFMLIGDYGPYAYYTYKDNTGDQSAGAFLLLLITSIVYLIGMVVGMRLPRHWSSDHSIFVMSIVLVFGLFTMLTWGRW